MNTSKEMKRKNMLRRAASPSEAGPAPAKMTKHWPGGAPPVDRSDSSDDQSSRDADVDSPKPASPPEQPKRKRFRMKGRGGAAPRKQLSLWWQQKNPNPYDLIPKTPPVSPKKPKRAKRQHQERIEKSNQAKELEEIREKFEKVEVNETETLASTEKQTQAQPLRRSKRLQLLKSTEKRLQAQPLRRSDRLKEKTWKDLI